MKRLLSPFSGAVAIAAMAASTMAAEITYQGQIKAERFDGTGGGLAGLVTNTKFVNNNPDSVKFIGTGLWYNLEPDPVNDFGARISGFITPTESGEYVFFASADDNVAVYLSTDATAANLKLIAADIGWQNARTWTGPGGDTTKRRGDFAGNGPFENRSDQFLTSPRVVNTTGGPGPVAGAGLPRGVPSATGADKPWPTVDATGNAVINLTAGQAYYFELIYGEGSGGAHTGLAWAKKEPGVDLVEPANGVPETEIPATFLSVKFTDTFSFKTQPTNQTRLQGQTATIVGEANAFPGNLTYQWFDNGVAIDPAVNPTAATPTLTIAGLTIADHNGHKYKVTVTSDFDPNTPKVITSSEMTLSVSEDTVAPTVLRIRTSQDHSIVGGVDTPMNTVRVYFSEPVDDAAIATANYAFTPALTVDDAIWDTDLHQEALILPVAGADPHIADDPRHRMSVILLVSGMTTNTTYSLAISNVKDLAGNALTPNTKPVTSPVFMTGTLNYRRWMGNNSIPTFQADTLRVANPSTAGTLNIAETVFYADGENDYVARVNGYFIAPQNGDYVFYMSADNDGFFYLSTDSDPANLRIVAADIGWQGARVWTGPGGDTVKRRGDTLGGGPFENRTDEFLTSPRGTGNGLPAGATIGWPTVDANGNQQITLVAGQRYYFELYHREYEGGRVEVTYKIPPAADPVNGTASIMTGPVIGALVDPSSLLPAITTQPTNVNFTIGGTVSLVVAANSAQPATYQWFKNGVAITGQTSATLTINNATASDMASYYVVVTNENGSVTSATVAALTVVPAPALTFKEDNTGTTVIEAEHYYAASTAADGHLWAPASGRADASGGGYMTILPDSGVNLGTPANFSTVARLDLRINFVTTGTHYLWIRGGDPVAGGAGDSVHAGFDGASVPAGVQITGAPTFNTTAWNWVGLNSAGARVAVEVPTAGVHTVNLFMREDGFLADKIILTTDVAFTPTGQGPAESQQDGGNRPNLSVSHNGSAVTITYTGTLVSSTTVNGTYSAVAGATGGTYTVPAGSGTVFFQALQ
jgi:hypothetical protein